MSMDALISEVLGQARGIARDVLQREGTRLRTATVTQIDPLRIRYDGEDEASVVPPRRATPVVAGDRVVVAKARGQATIIGVLGGSKWETIPVPSGWAVDGSNEIGYTVTSGVCSWAGVVQKTGTLPSGWTDLGYAPEEVWPRRGDQLRTLPTTSGRTVIGKIHASDGRIQIWIDQASSGIFMHFSAFSYAII